ncbi:lysozyme inhibitor LprI family protein [Pseudomonas sp. EA_35y_Pfl2_R5]|uniref:lysozyme inhibitor LprI family protein n=1 Tax=Pseudomonas sp. EA_35y_Pfl2_R5 TaxID=3088690 RepID=UPI0030DA76EC
MRPTASAAMFVIAYCTTGYANDLPPKCNENGSAPEINACAQEEFIEADKKLNHQYKILISNLNSEDIALLRTEQRSWLKMRDPICREESKEYESTTGWIFWFNKCISAKTYHRTEELMRWRTE